MKYLALAVSLSLLCGLVGACGETATHTAIQPLLMGTWEYDNPEAVHRRFYEETTHSTPEQMAETLRSLRSDRLTFLADGTVWQTPRPPWTRAHWRCEGDGVTISCDQYGDIGQPLDFPYRLKGGMLVEAFDDSRVGNSWRRITEIGAPNLPVGVWIYADPDAAAARVVRDSPVLKIEHLSWMKATRFEFRNDGKALARSGEHTTTGRWVRQNTEIQFIPSGSELPQGSCFRVSGDRLLQLWIYESFELRRAKGR